MTFRTAVIGYGNVGGWHSYILSKHPDAELVAVVDTDEERRADARDDDHNATVYADIGEALEAESLDLVHVCVPPKAHFDVAETVMTQDVPVLVEKPATTRTEEVKQLQELVDETGVQASVVHNKRFEPAVQRALRLVESGEIGEVVATTMLFGEHRDVDQGNRGDWVFDLAGGEIGEGIAHQAYLPLAFTERLGEVEAVSTHNYGEHEKVDFDGVTIEATDSSGRQSITIKVITSSAYQDTLYVYGTEGLLEVDVLNRTIVMRRGTNSASRVGRIAQNLSVARQRVTGAVGGGIKDHLSPLLLKFGYPNLVSGHYVQFTRYFETLENDETPPVTLDDAYDSVTLLETLEKSV